MFEQPCCKNCLMHWFGDFRKFPKRPYKQHWCAESAGRTSHRRIDMHSISEQHPRPDWCPKLK